MHALSDGAGRLLVVLLTAGNVHDTTMFGQLLAAVRVARTGPGANRRWGASVRRWPLPDWPGRVDDRARR